MDAGPVPVPGLSLSARLADGIAIAELSGELDLVSSPDLRDELLSLLRRSSSRLVVDLSRVTYADASGLAVLVGTGRRARLLGGSLRLAAVPPQVDQVLHVPGLHRHLDVLPTVRAAAASLQGSLPGPAYAAARDQAAGALPVLASAPAGHQVALADMSELRDVTADLLTHADAWRDADPGRRFAPALRALARAWSSGDDTALEAAARSLVSALVRYPLSYSQAVATSATQLRRVFEAGRRPALLLR